MYVLECQVAIEAFKGASRVLVIPKHREAVDGLGRYNGQPGTVRREFVIKYSNGQRSTIAVRNNERHRDCGSNMHLNEKMCFFRS